VISPHLVHDVELDARGICTRQIPQRKVKFTATKVEPGYFSVSSPDRPLVLEPIISDLNSEFQFLHG